MCQSGATELVRVVDTHTHARANLPLTHTRARTRSAGQRDITHNGRPFICRRALPANRHEQWEAGLIESTLLSGGWNTRIPVTD